jgi:hypothetical protein
MVLPASVADATLHRFWSGPASARVGLEKMVTDTSSDNGVHIPLDTVHLKTYVPCIKPVTEVLFKIRELNVAVFGPLTCDQFPTPFVGATAAMVATEPHTLFWSGPAFGVSTELMFIVTLSAVAQEPLVTFHS